MKEVMYPRFELTDVAKVSEIPIRNPPEYGAGNAAYSTEHGGDEGLQARKYPKIRRRKDTIGHAIHQAGCRAEGTAYCKGGGNGLINIDAHELRAISAECDSAHRLPSDGVLDEQVQQHHQYDGERKIEDVHRCYVERPQAEVLDHNEGRKADVIRTKDDVIKRKRYGIRRKSKKVLEEERHSHRSRQS
jgi:hypothetical protein